MAFGKSAGEVRGELEKDGMTKDAVDALVPHKVFEGNRPSNSQKLTPRMLWLGLGTGS